MGEKQRKRSDYIQFVEKELDIISPEKSKLRRTLKNMCKELEGFNDVERKVIVRLFAMLGSYIPLTQLTGEDDEWEKVDVAPGSNIEYINKRCPRIYKRTDGTAFDSEYYTFTFGDGIYFRNEASNKDIEFPYTVKPSIRRKWEGKKDDSIRDLRNDEKDRENSRGDAGNSKILS